MAIEGISLAFDDVPLEPDPDWTRIDAGVTRVASYTIDRGRQFELDTTDGGRATIAINDVDGSLDPTNTTGDYYGLIEPLMQAGIARWNPFVGEWQTRFRGFVEDFDYVFDPSQRVNQLTISLVDIWEFLQTCEMKPVPLLYAGAFGETPPAESVGNVYFPVENVDDRIRSIAGTVVGGAVVDDFFVIFTGNVELWASVYSPGESALTALQEAVDAEFPGVSNFYPDRFGRGCFHGRLAKFNPSGTAESTTTDRWDYQQWKAGDGAAVSGDSDYAQIREFSFNRGTWAVRNSALATYMGIAQADVTDQAVEDSVSIAARGLRPWSKQYLLTKRGLLDSSDALTETRRFAQYIVDNYAQPRNRISNIGFRPVRPTDPRAETIWKLLCQADIADSMEVTVASPGGGGFNLEPCFIEGVHEEVRGRLRDGVAEGDEGYDDVTMRFDLSPQALFTSNPFPTS